MVCDCMSIPSLCIAAMSCQFIDPLFVVSLHIIKNVALNPYLSKIGLAYVKSPFLLSSKDRITTLSILEILLLLLLLLLLPPPLLVGVVLPVPSLPDKCALEE